MFSTGGSSPPIFPDNDKFDRTNWITWRENVTIAVHMRGAYGYLVGTINQPIPTSITFTTLTKPTAANTKSTLPETITFTSAITILAPNEIETK